MLPYAQKILIFRPWHRHTVVLFTTE